VLLIVIGGASAVVAIWLLIAPTRRRRRESPAELPGGDDSGSVVSPVEPQMHNSQHRLAVALILIGCAGTLLAWRWPSSSPGMSALVHKDNDPLFFMSSILMVLGVVLELVVLGSHEKAAAVRKSASNILVVAITWLAGLSVVYVIGHWSG
jgi:hypothetical protein